MGYVWPDNQCIPFLSSLRSLTCAARTFAWNLVENFTCLEELTLLGLADPYHHAQPHYGTAIAEKLLGSHSFKRTFVDRCETFAKLTNSPIASI